MAPISVLLGIVRPHSQTTGSNKRQVVIGFILARGLCTGNHLFSIRNPDSGTGCQT